MIQRESPHIDLGPGGSIPDTDANRELLERIKAAPELTPIQLLLLANFYHVYQTNTFLADHLTFIGETKSLPPPPFDLGDLWEDFREGYDRYSSEEDNEKLFQAKMKLNFQVYIGAAYEGQLPTTYPLTYAEYEIKCIPSLIPGLGLLIETHLGDDPHFIGVCPELES